MAYFARVLRYTLYDNELSGLSYILLAELVRKKGGRPAGFMLYRQTTQHIHAEMILVNNIETVEEVIRRFWHLNARGMPQVGSEQWVKTAPWLDLRTVFYPGTWVRVCIPRRRRKKRKPLQIGNLAHILLKYQAQLSGLSQERSDVSRELDEDDSKEYDRLLGVIAEIDERTASVVADINRTKEEMRYIVRKMFPKPMGRTPRRTLRREQQT